MASHLILTLILTLTLHYLVSTQDLDPVSQSRSCTLSLRNRLQSIQHELPLVICALTPSIPIPIAGAIQTLDSKDSLRVAHFIVNPEGVASNRGVSHRISSKNEMDGHVCRRVSTPFYTSKPAGRHCRAETVITAVGR